MISGWKIEYGVLKGRAGPDEYVVHECDGGWTAKRQSPEDEFWRPSSTQRTCEGAVLPSLPEAIKWCEDDEKSRWGWMNFKEEEKNTSATNNENPGDKVDKFSTRIDEFVRDWEAWRARHFTAVPQPGAFAATTAANEPPIRRSPSWPLESFDARDWAKEFIRINRDCVVGIVGHVDEEDMISWFANSLMRGFEEGKKFANGSQSERALRDRAPRSPGPEAPLYLCLPDLCRVFAQTSAAYEAHRALPCPKDGFDGWQAVNAVLNQIAEAVSSAASGVRVVWNAAPNMEENPLGEVGKFEPAGTGSGPQPSDRESVAPETSAPMSGLKSEVLRGGLPEEPGLKNWTAPASGKHPLDRLKERIDQVNESFDDFRVDKQKQIAALADQGRLHERNIDALDAGLVALKSVVTQLKIDFLRGLKLANARIGVLESKSGGGWSKRLSDLEARQRALETLEGGPK